MSGAGRCRPMVGRAGPRYGSRVTRLGASTGLFSLACLVGCYGDVDTVFPEGLDPLEDNLAPALEGCPEGVTLREGERDAHVWVHARGCVPAGLTATWAAMRTPEVSVDRRQVDAWTVTQGTEPAYDFSYTVHNTVNQIITVRYDMAWRHGLVEGDMDDPELVAARWQKVAGSEVIAVLEGSALAYPIDETHTEIELIYRLDGLLRNPSDIRSFVEDYHASIRAVATGAPLPDR